MALIDNTLESIRVKETYNPTFLASTLYPNRSRVWQTSELTTANIVGNGILYKEFKPSTTFKTLITGGLSLFWLVLVTSSHFENGDVAMLLFITVYTIAAAQYIYLVHVDKRLNFNILVSKQGIKIDALEYTWSAISATAILWLPAPRNGVYYLIILHEDDTYEKYNLSNFYMSRSFINELSTYIEYFKLYA
jgi:hypothetical protein